MRAWILLYVYTLMYMSTVVIINPKSEMTFLSYLAHHIQQTKSFPASPRLSLCDRYSIHSCIFSDGSVGIFLVR